MAGYSLKLRVLVACAGYGNRRTRSTDVGGFASIRSQRGAGGAELVHGSDGDPQNVAPLGACTQHVRGWARYKQRFGGCVRVGELPEHLRMDQCRFGQLGVDSSIATPHSDRAAQFRTVSRLNPTMTARMPRRSRQFLNRVTGMAVQ